jgi:hypothetical protein
MSLKKDPDSEPYSSSDESNSHSHTLFIEYSFLILSSIQMLVFQVVSSDFLTKYMYAFLTFPCVLHDLPSCNNTLWKEHIMH